MKKLIYTTALALVGLVLNAQIKVYSGGNVGIGSTTTTPLKPLDVIGSGGIRISQTADSTNTNELYFQQNGQIRSTDDNHRIIFDQGGNILELREYGDIMFSPNATGGKRTNKVRITSGGNVNVISLTNGYQIGGNTVLWQNNVSSCIFVGTNTGHSTTGSYNSAFGDSSLYANTTGAANVAIGYTCLKNNTGDNNVAAGDRALYHNTSGSANTAFGHGVLVTNTTSSYNSGFGYEVLQNNTGTNNTGMGYQALSANTSGNYNTGVGYQAIYSTTSGNYNTSLGYSSLYANTTGVSNTAIGYNAGVANATGANNTFLGFDADASGNYSNATAIGNGSYVLASNRVEIGNNSVTQIGGYVAWTNLSDGRFKTNVTENVKGLAFIKKLRPVTYNLDTKAADDFITQNMPDSLKPLHKDGANYVASTSIVHSGFIAQEVEQAAQQVGFTNSIVSAPANATDVYALSYGEFVVPLVKAMQELSATTDSLKKVVHKQDSLIQTLQNQINGCCNAGNRSIQGTGGLNQGILNNQQTTGINTSTPTNTNGAMLYQNTPNPWNQTTIVKCYVPQGSQNVSLLVFDLNGTLKSTFAINETGTVNITINANQLISGMYYYTLIINGQEIDTKKMILTE
jgi:hypothetical protein